MTISTAIINGNGAFIDNYDYERQIFEQKKLYEKEMRKLQYELMYDRKYLEHDTVAVKKQVPQSQDNTTLLLLGN